MWLIDFNPNSATNTETDRQEDKLVDASKTRLGPLPLFCLVTVLNLINGFFSPERLNKKLKTAKKKCKFWLCSTTDAASGLEETYRGGLVKSLSFNSCCKECRVKGAQCAHFISDLMFPHSLVPVRRQQPGYGLNKLTALSLQAGGFNVVVNQDSTGCDTLCVLTHYLFILHQRVLILWLISVWTTNISSYSVHCRIVWYMQFFPALSILSRKQSTLNLIRPGCKTHYKLEANIDRLLQHFSDWLLTSDQSEAKQGWLLWIHGYKNWPDLEIASCILC